MHTCTCTYRSYLAIQHEAFCISCIAFDQSVFSYHNAMQVFASSCEASLIHKDHHEVVEFSSILFLDYEKFVKLIILLM